MVSFFLLELVAELLDSAGEGGGKDSKVDMEGASLCIFKLITPWSVSNLSIAHKTLKMERKIIKVSLHSRQIRF